MYFHFIRTVLTLFLLCGRINCANVMKSMFAVCKVSSWINQTPCWSATHSSPADCGRVSRWHESVHVSLDGCLQFFEQACVYVIPCCSCLSMLLLYFSCVSQGSRPIWETAKGEQRWRSWGTIQLLNLSRSLLLSKVRLAPTLEFHLKPGLQKQLNLSTMRINIYIFTLHPSEDFRMFGPSEL